MHFRSSIVVASLVAAAWGCSKSELSSGAPSLTVATGIDGGTAELPDLPSQTGLPPVDLAGVAHPAPPPPTSGPRLASIAMETHVYAKADTSAAKLGQLRAGAIVEMEPRAVQGPGCPGSFRKIKPMGFVCLGDQATLDLEHPIARASTRRPDPSERLPYVYGTVKRGGPVYSRIPTDEDLKLYEPHLASHLKRWVKDKESGASYGLDLWMRYRTAAGGGQPMIGAADALAQGLSDKDIPWFLQNGGTVPNLSGTAKGGAVKIGEVATHNGVSFVDTFLHNGRRYGLTTDLRVLPTDRLRPIRGSDYHGVRLPDEAAMPFAIIRKRGQKKLHVEGGKLKVVGRLPYRAVVSLTGHQRFIDGVLHYETQEGDWIDDRGTSRVEIPKKMPGWAVNGERWIDINIHKQMLILFEGEKPVYVTLVSTGEAGLGDPEKTKSTKRGIFRIHTKYLATTMDSRAVGEEFELRDVPYVQYFQDGYALHAAYWHDVFGMPKSHGCINLSPEDARRIFFWTEPKVPEGWHGAAKALTGTVVFIHE